MSTARWRMWWPILRLALRSREARRRLSLIVIRHMPALMLETAADLVMTVLGSVYALASVYVLALIVWGFLAH